MSFILDALRKSDQRRQGAAGPDLASAPGDVAASARPARRRGLRLGLVLLALIVMVTFAVIERDRLQLQWVAWTGQGEDSGRSTVPDPIEPVVPGSEAAESADPGGVAYRERVQTPRERLISDPAAARAEIERLVAEQNASESASPSASTVIDRRSPTPSRPGQSISRAAPARERGKAPSAEETARIQQRLDDARRRAQQSVAGLVSDSEPPAEAQPGSADGGAPGQSGGGSASLANGGVPNRAGGRASVTPPSGGSNAVNAGGRANSYGRAADMRDPAPVESPSQRADEAPAVAGNAASPGARAALQTGPDASTLSESGAMAEVAPWSPEAAEYIRAWELPLSIRRSLPALTLNIHVFSELPAERFVLINGERYVSGDELVDGAQLVAIRREGAVVDYRDYRFLLEP